LPRTPPPAWKQAGGSSFHGSSARRLVRHVPHVLRVAGQVGVVGRHHRGVYVAEEFRHLGDPHAVHEGRGRKTMACDVGNDPLQVRQLLPQQTEAAADAVLGEAALREHAVDADPPHRREQRPLGGFAISLRVSSIMAAFK
jgi:hypothetical protein